MPTPFGPKLNGYHDAGPQVAQHLWDRARVFFDAHDDRKAGVRTRDEVRAWQARASISY